MIIFNKLDNYFVVSADSQTFLGFEITANFRDTSPLNCLNPEALLSTGLRVRRQEHNRLFSNNVLQCANNYVSISCSKGLKLRGLLF